MAVVVRVPPCKLIRPWENKLVSPLTDTSAPVPMVSVPGPPDTDKVGETTYPPTAKALETSQVDPCPETETALEALKVSPMPAVELETVPPAAMVIVPGEYRPTASAPEFHL